MLGRFAHDSCLFVHHTIFCCSCMLLSSTSFALDVHKITVHNGANVCVCVRYDTMRCVRSTGFSFVEWNAFFASIVKSIMFSHFALITLKIAWIYIYIFRTRVSFWCCCCCCGKSESVCIFYPSNLIASRLVKSEMYWIEENTIK